MPEQVKALIVILFVALPVFWFAKQPITGIISEKDYVRSRNLWLAVTLIVFLSHNYWIYIVTTGLLFVKQGMRYENPLALYCLLLTACPQLWNVIPGPGPILQIITLDYYRLLNLTLLAPLAGLLYRNRVGRDRVPRVFDLFVCGLLLWMFGIQAAASESVTNTARFGFYLLLDIWLPYYVGSRALNELRDFHQLAAALVTASTVMATLAVLESSRRWLLYSPLRAALGLPPELTTYLIRGEGGPLRAVVSFGHSIVLGYVLVVALAMTALIYPVIRPVWKRNLAVLVLSAGLIATLSRGPWVGAVAMLVMLFALGPGLGKRVIWSIIGGGVATLLLFISPWGDEVIAYLPFVGTVDSGSVAYRSKLVDVSMVVFNQHPFIGDFNYLRNPLMEQMRQGQGIIDMVNTYLQYALPYGGIGVFLFLGIFITALRGIKRVRAQMHAQSDIEWLGRVLLATLVGTLIIIATVSSVGVIPTMYWLLVGISASYIRIFGTKKAAVRQRADSPPAHIRYSVGRKFSKT